MSRGHRSRQKGQTKWHKSNLTSLNVKDLNHIWSQVFDDLQFFWNPPFQSKTGKVLLCNSGFKQTSSKPVVCDLGYSRGILATSFLLSVQVIICMWDLRGILNRKVSACFWIFRTRNSRVNINISSCSNSCNMCHYCHCEEIKQMQKGRRR